MNEKVHCQKAALKQSNNLEVPALILKVALEQGDKDLQNQEEMARATLAVKAQDVWNCPGKPQGSSTY